MASANHAAVLAAACGRPVPLRLARQGKHTVFGGFLRYSPFMTSHPIRAVASAALLCAAFLPQPARAATATVQVVGSVVKVRPADSVSGSGGATLVAARNEFESFQVVTTAGAGPVTDLTVSLLEPLSGPGGTIPARNVTIYREAYYDVVFVSDSEGATGPWPDAVIPAVDPWYHQTRNAFPIDVPAGENRVAWVDVLVPQNQTAGDYDGSLEVSGDGLDVVVPVHLTVIDWGMPSTASLASGFGMGWDTVCLAHYGDDCITHEADGWALKALYARAALDDRVTLAYPEYQPLANQQERAWFEQYTLPLLAGTAQTRLPGAKLTAIYVDLGPWLAGWRDEARAKGFEDRSIAYVCDEPNEDPSTWQQCKQRAQGSLAVWPQVSILITATINNARKFNATSLIDTLVPIVNEMHDKPGNSQYSGNQRRHYNAFLEDSRNRLWTYTSCETEGCGDAPTPEPYWIGWPGYPIDEPASEARAMGWQSFRYRASGELYYDVDYSLVKAWSSDMYDFGGNGDGTLFYPGTPAMVGGTRDIPIETMRLKLIRDGYEDFEYMKYLQDNGKGPQAMAVVKGLFSKMYDSSRSDPAVQSARAQLIGLVASVGGDRP
jgi:glycosyl hydrolase family 123